jgi:biopolymer transport protein ExbD
VRGRRIHPALGRGDGGFEAPNVVPLIDVVMCLIIFFLIVGKLAADVAAVRLPESGIGRTEASGRAVVIAIAPVAGGAGGAGGAGTVNLGGTAARVWVDGVPVLGLEELKAAVRERGAALLTELGRPGDALGELPVQIRADRELAFATVEPVLRACADLGLTAVRLAAERKP